MESVATHLPVLIESVCRTSDSVLELGCGFYSTYTLHAACKPSGRRLVSCEHDKSWISKFRHLATDWHTLLYTEDWDTTIDTLRHQYWSIIFIDHAPGERRIKDIKTLSESCEHMIIHDTQESSYGYEEVLPLFKYRNDFRVFGIGTSVVSNTTKWE